MLFRSWIIGAIGLTVATAAASQPLEVGNLPSAANVPVGGPAPATVFDFSVHPVSSGVLSSVTFAYSTFPCPSAVKIKFFRPLNIAARFLGERGPFDVNQAVQTVSLSPPVAVQTADWIAITKLSDCGSPLAAAGGTDALATFPGDVKNDIIIEDLTQGFTLSLLASGTRTPLNGVAAVIPVAYDGPGLAGSSFRTETQFSNPTSSPAAGWVLYTFRIFTGINPFNPAFMPYALGPYETKTVDLRSSFGSLSLGNLDMIPTTGPSPLVSVHLFNDLGPTGTLGFTAPDVPISEMLATGDRGFLVGPSDPTYFRFNVGLRGVPFASLLISLRSSDGTLVATKSQGAGILFQVSAQDLLGVPLPPNAMLTFEVTSGIAVVYGVTADNRTNDVSYQLARKVPASQ